MIFCSLCRAFFGIGVPLELDRYWPDEPVWLCPNRYCPGKSKPETSVELNDDQEIPV